MKKKAIRMKSDEGFSVIALIIMSIFAVICVIPFLLIVSGSLSSEMAITVNGYRLLPQDFSLAAYSYLWARKATILRCLGLSVLVTGVGTLVSVLITSACAYPMSRPDFPLRNVLALFIFIPMIFTGGMTASYIMWSKYLGVRNTIWALLLPNALVGSMNILLVRNYYTMNIPYALVEASKWMELPSFSFFPELLFHFPSRFLQPSHCSQVSDTGTTGSTECITLQMPIIIPLQSISRNYWTISIC